MAAPPTPSSARNFAPRRVVTSSRSCAAPSSMTVAIWSPEFASNNPRSMRTLQSGHVPITRYEPRTNVSAPKLVRAIRRTSARRSVSGLVPRSVRQRATSSAGMACSLPLAASSDVSISANAVCSQASVGVLERSRMCSTATDLRRIVFSLDWRVQNHTPAATVTRPAIARASGQRLLLGCGEGSSITVGAALRGSSSILVTVATNRYPFPGSVAMKRFSPRFSPRTLRSIEMLWVRLFSSTAAPFQTSASNSSFEMVSPARSTKTSKVASGLGMSGTRSPAFQSAP